MITKFARAQNNWVAKLILGLTALSFMSLFGVAGYYQSAGENRTVIKVDDIEISKAQFNYMLQKELNAAKNLLGEDGELTDEMRDALIAGQIETIVNESVLDRSAEKYHILFRPEFIQALIMNEPSFKLNGRFDSELFRRTLSENNSSEAEYIAALKRDLTRRLLVDLPTSGIQVPLAMINSEALVDNKRRSFKFIQVSPDNMEIGRTISEDEIEQYYEDFTTNFMTPETRDLTLLKLSNEKIMADMDIPAQDIEQYYNENRSEYETPEKRHLLQMMFDDETSANKAFFELQNGADFYAVAEKHAGQSKTDTNLGETAADELSEDISAEVFALPQGAHSKPLQTGDQWQIFKVISITQGSKTPLMRAAVEIRKTLADERLYDETYRILSEMEDKFAAGETLEAVAKDYAAELKKLDAVEEEYTQSAPDKTLENPDVLETAFNYAEGETSRVLETDDGLVAMRVEKVHEPYLKALDEVKDEIRTLWVENEKTALTRETVADMMHNLENGEDITSVAQRYGLRVYTSQPITRNETFAGIGYDDIREMFTDPLKTPHQIQQEEDYIIAVAVNDYKNSAPMDQAEQDIIRRNAYQALIRDYADALIASYAADYKVRIKYKLLGLSD